MDWFDKNGIRDKSNPFWPLPRDYGDLTIDGQRQARLSVLCDQSTPIKLVIAWNTFRRIYLCNSKQAPFYKKGFSESPDFHYSMIRDLGQFGRNAYAAPRGFAKSSVITEEMSMLLSLTRPFFDITIALSTDRQMTDRFDTIMNQFQENELIINDFGILQPKRGQALWNHSHLSLNIGSKIRGLSVMGKKRGGRPKLFILDDPENDPDSDSETSRMALLEKFEMILFRQIIPMLEAGSCIFWIGTLIDRKAFLYRATMSDDDPRFNVWNRKVLKAIATDEDDPKKVYLLWPEKWPKEVLDARLEEIGPSAFHSEYLNEPISPQDRILQVDPKKNEYIVEGEMDMRNPLNHTGKIKWFERKDTPAGRVYVEEEKPYCELVKPMFRAILFDYASGLTSYNDYSCIAVVGFDTLMTMWILNMWLGRAKDATLMRMIWETGLAWQPRVIGIEAVSIQKAFAEALRDYVAEQEAHVGPQWRGRVFPITYPARESKAQRISSALEWRFTSGRIKYPAHLANTWPYNELYAQTADFTMDLALLQHDDAIDTLAESKYVVKTRGNQRERERGKPSLLERIIRNQPEVKGMPLLSGVPSEQLSDEMLNVLSQKAHSRIINPRTRRIERRRPNIVR